MIPSNQRNQTPNQNKIRMIPQFQGVDLLLLEPSKLEFLPDSESNKIPLKRDASGPEGYSDTSGLY